MLGISLGYDFELIIKEYSLISVPKKRSLYEWSQCNL